MKTRILSLLTAIIFIALMQIPETCAADEMTDPDSWKMIFTLEPVCQYPELPTGCEVTCLTMLLNYWGFPADKEELADDYLEKGDPGIADFRDVFVGNPRYDDSYGCYAPVIQKAAEKYLADQEDTDYLVLEQEGVELEELFEYLRKDIPVAVWVTIDCLPGSYSESWYAGDHTVYWFQPEHCMVLLGYTDSLIWVADPIYGDIRSYDRDAFRAGYDALYQQSVVIAPEEMLPGDTVAASESLFPESETAGGF